MPDQNIAPARGEREGSRGVRNFLLGHRGNEKTSFPVVSDRDESSGLPGWHILSILRSFFLVFLILVFFIKRSSPSKNEGDLMRNFFF